MQKYELYRLIYRINRIKINEKPIQKYYFEIS